MKKTSPLNLLLIFLVLLFVVYGVVSIIPDKENPEDQHPVPIPLVGLDKDAIYSITWKNREAKTTVKFINKEEKWQVETKLPYDFDQTKIDARASSVVYLNATESTPLAENWSDYGLDSPSIIVEVQPKSADLITISLGDLTPTGDNAYVKVDALPTLFLISSYDYNQLSLQWNDLRENAIQSIPAAEISAVSIKNDERSFSIIRLAETDPGTPPEFILRNFYPSDMPLSYEKAQTFIRSLPSSFSISEFADTIRPLQAGLGAHAKTLTLKGLDGTSKTFEFGKQANENEVYFRVAGTSQVYTVANGYTEFLKTKPFDLVSRFLISVPAEEMTAIHLKRGVDDWRITAQWTSSNDEFRDGNEPLAEKEGRFTLNDRELDEMAFRSLVNKIEDLVLEGEAPKGLSGKEVATLSIVSKTKGEQSFQFYTFKNGFYKVGLSHSSPLFVLGEYQIQTLFKYIASVYHETKNSTETNIEKP